jgi:hypothetical protein
MSDPLDAGLLRSFAASRRPLEDAQFVARVISELAGARGWSERVHGALRTLGMGLAAGISAPLRLRYAGLMVLVVAAVTVWSLLQRV